ncbi:MULTISPECIES: hypothetical protein [unclassified Chryseobacterium]|jgi:uncharacterized protein (UPF0333 family)|uniref:hypothetical protein n=1 Tax=unclassified Chryseobacterium TaxID=2593645 RepID=UPI000E239B4D|nr:MULTISPECIES: hypothetical protein [unclassified Chryseobacterium]REC41771.1 hypothetical protein DRF69_13635 [Chryseobacterium sp. 5_R23647]
MKNFLLGFFIILTLSACTHSAKDPDTATVKQETPTSQDDITKVTIADRHGDEMEIITNNTKNTVVVRLNGQSYELKKNIENPSFSTEDNKYQFTETKYEVTFLKKDADMVLFHAKKDQPAKKIALQ